MVIGNGLIAKRFHSFEQKPFIIYASGISNSKADNPEAMSREQELVYSTIKQFPALPLIYFSTYSVDDPELSASAYVRHKMNIEQLIKENAGSFYIIRTSNVVGQSHANRHTIVNYIYDHILHGTGFDLWSGAFRNVLDIDHLYRIVEDLLAEGSSNGISYVVNPVCYRVSEIVRVMEHVLQREARYRLIDKGVRFECDTSLSTLYFEKFSISQEGYLEQVIRKYYSP